jgi:glycosyltransferase involved in cell wall biosynthesis
MRGGPDQRPDLRRFSIDYLKSPFSRLAVSRNRSWPQALLGNEEHHGSMESPANRALNPVSNTHAASLPRVLHVIDALRIGGAEMLLVALVSELTRSGRARSAVCAFSRDAAEARLVADLGRSADALTLVPQSRLYDPRVIGAVLGAALRFKPDVIHSHLSGANATSRIVAALVRRPHATTIHTLPGPRSEDNRARRLAEGLTARLSNRLVAPSAEMAAAYAAAYHLPRSRFRIVANAPVAAPPPGFDREAFRGGLLGGRPGRLVLCVARLEAEKGIDDLIAAAELLRATRPDVRVLVAGGGTEHERLRDRIERGGLGDSVQLLGPRTDVGQLLAAADAFCLPSRYEGLPVSLLEALAAGLPCVVTAVGAVPALVRDGESALVVPPAEPPQLARALELVLGDATLAARLGRMGQVLVREHHSLPAVAARYADLYEELIGLAPRRRRVRSRSAESAARASAVDSSD